MIMQEFTNTIEIIHKIKSVNLFHAAVSIEQEKVHKFMEICNNNSFQTKIINWNYPESVYIGVEDEKTHVESIKNLATVCIKWN